MLYHKFSTCISWTSNEEFKGNELLVSRLKFAKQESAPFVGKKHFGL